MQKQRMTAAAVSLSAIAVLGLSACSSDESGSADSGAAAETTQGMTSPEMTQGMTSPGMTGDMQAASTGLVGPGCAEYAAMVPTGAGSVDGMAQDPVAVAA